MLKWLYERVTGTPWLTEWRASVEFGPPPGAVYQRELAVFSDLELLRHGDEIVAALRARDRRRAEVQARAVRVG